MVLLVSCLNLSCRIYLPPWSGAPDVFASFLESVILTCFPACFPRITCEPAQTALLLTWCAHSSPSLCATHFTPIKHLASDHLNKPDTLLPQGLSIPYCLYLEHSSPKYPQGSLSLAFFGSLFKQRLSSEAFPEHSVYNWTLPLHFFQSIYYLQTDYIF